MSRFLPCVQGSTNPSVRPGDTTTVANSSAEQSRPSTATTFRFDGSERSAGYTQTTNSPAIPAQAHKLKHSPEPASNIPSRAFGVHSILNPSSELQADEVAGHRFSPPDRSTTHDRALPPISSPRGRKRAEPNSPTVGTTFAAISPGRVGRRVLTPKSSSLRAPSLGIRRDPPEIGSFQQQNLSRHEERPYTIELGLYRGADIPPLPPLSIATAGNLPDLSRTEAPSSFPRTTLPSTSHAVLSGRAGNGRPDSPHSSARRSDQNSQNTRYGPNAPPSTLATPAPPMFRGLSTAPHTAYGPTTSAHGPHEGYQSGPASYQISLDTEQGPMIVPVELDLQQASKVADEKRKRNAGASARFRARRKEKEKEASQTIHGLQHELKETLKQRDFYFTERNWYRDFVVRNMGPNQLPPRPSSPQMSQYEPPPMSAGSPSGTEDNFGHQEPYLGNVQRRRTGEYQPSFTGPALAGPSMAPPFAPSYPPQPPPPLSLPAGGSQAMFQEAPRTVPTASAAPPPTSRSQSYDPFRRDPFDRSWNPGR